MLSTVLKRAKYETLEASNGIEGCQMYRQHPCDLVITDICMPEKDGNDVIEELKTEFADVKIIAISGGGFFRGEVVLDIAKSLGVDVTLQKPIKMKQLLNKVHELIGE